MRDDIHMMQKLREAGLSPTPQRVAIGEILLGRPQHMTAEQVHARVSTEIRPVSLATVYNTLKAFVEKGLLREVVVDPGRVYYDSTVANHHHFYNVETGELTDIPADQVNIAGLPVLPRGAEVAGVDVIIRIRPTH